MIEEFGIVESEGLLVWIREQFEEVIVVLASVDIVTPSIANVRVESFFQGYGFVPLIIFENVSV